MSSHESHLVDVIKSHSGLTTTFAKQQSVSSDAQRVMKSIAKGVEAAHEEYNHALSSALDANTYSRYKTAHYAQKIIDTFNKRESMKHMAHDFMNKPVNEIESLSSSATRLNSYMSQFLKNYVVENNIKSSDGNIRSEVDRRLSGNDDARKYQEYLDNELRRIIKYTELEGQVEQVNLLNEIKREFLREVGIEHDKKYDASYTPQHADITLN